MTSTATGIIHCPVRHAIQALKAAKARQGITIHVPRCV
jgi:hypothetical protein